MLRWEKEQLDGSVSHPLHGFQGDFFDVTFARSFHSHFCKINGPAFSRPFSNVAFYLNVY